MDPPRGPRVGKGAACPSAERCTNRDPRVSAISPGSWRTAAQPDPGLLFHHGNGQELTVGWPVPR
jgi:hypothetical protein